MKAVVCDRCGAVFPGVEEPYARVRLFLLERTYKPNQNFGGVSMPHTEEKTAVQEDLCSSCEHDIRAFLKKKPDRVNVAARCDPHCDHSNHV